MANYYPKKRRKLKYQNLALLLAIFLLIVLIIGKGCSALFSREKKPDEDKKDPLVTDDQQQGELPENNSNADPTNQKYYFFMPITVNSSDIGDGNLVLVNNNIPFKGTVTEDELDVVREKKNSAYSVKDYTVLVQPEVMEHLNTMLLDFYTATGSSGVMVNAGYRTLEYQQDLYDEDLASSGENSSSLVAKPGYSEHHTGLAIDFTVYEDNKYDQSKIGTGDYAWINENCHKYGFINRYPLGKEALTMIDNEPWHFRYVGVAHATAMKNFDFCLEEYIDFIKNYTILNGFLSVNTDDGAQYMIYYTPMGESDSTSIYIPIKEGADTPDPSDDVPYPYEISGNNVDGWIVTFQFKAPDTVPNILPPDSDVSSEDGGDETENGENSDGTNSENNEE